MSLELEDSTESASITKIKKQNCGRYENDDDANDDEHDVNGVHPSPCHCSNHAKRDDENLGTSEHEDAGEDPETLFLSRSVSNEPGFIANSRILSIVPPSESRFALRPDVRREDAHLERAVQPGEREEHNQNRVRQEDAGKLVTGQVDGQDRGCRDKGDLKEPLPQFKTLDNLTAQGRVLLLEECKSFIEECKSFIVAVVCFVGHVPRLCSGQFRAAPQSPRRVGSAPRSVPVAPTG